jgi:general secretion pathway protein H
MDTYKISGFTLIEVMVLLAIIAIVVALASVNYAPDDKQRLQQEGHKLSMLLSHAYNTARTTGKPIAWTSKKQSYEFLELDQDGKYWTPLFNNPNLYSRRLLDGVTIQKVMIGGSKSSDGDLIVFSPSGLNPAFNIQLNFSQYHVIVHGNLLGDVEDLPATEIKH